MTITGEPEALKNSEEEVFALPVSFSQQRLWFLHQLEPGGSAYNLLHAFKLDGRLDLIALERSLDEIVRRHEILRTTFAAPDGAPAEIIHPPRHQPLSSTDLSRLPAEARDAEAARLIADEARRPFDLAAGPLFRRTLIKIGREEHILLLALNHIVSDGWSTGILLREISVLYDAFSAGQESPLRPLSIQYADFAVWQREWLKGEIFERQLSYWKKQLDGIPPVLELPTDRPRPAVPTFHGAFESFVLPRSLAAALRLLSRQERVTLFMTLLAAFQTLLHRYTGQDDIAVGSPIAGRQRAELEDLIGFFINTLVLRADLSGNPTFKQLLARARETALGAYAHQDLPFEKLVEEINPDRTLSPTPLFQVMFVFQNMPASALELRGLAVRPIRPAIETAKFDLTLWMTESADSLAGSLGYNTDLFDAATIARIAGHFRMLLESIVADPARRLSDFSVLTPAERKQILVDWNDTKRDYPTDKLLHELFEEQVERAPDRVAVMFADRQLTYRELNSRANQLARYLQKLGVGSEVLVGICMDRSIEMIVALLGVLKAGGAYVPLDPKYPNERLAFILEQSQAKVLLTQERLLNVIAGHGVHALCLESDWPLVAQESEKNPSSTAGPENLAYVIYTSGSTGRPKGVLIEHRQILNYAQGIRERYDLKPGAAFAMVQPLSVDSSQTVIFPALISGGCLHVIVEETAADAEALGAYFSRHPMDLLKIAPSHLAALETAANFPQILPRRRLIIGGEASRRDWAEKLRSIASCSIFNHYGPTEATVGMLTYEVREEKNGRNSSTLPIGSPLPNAQVFLLDRDFQPVPVGVSGELYIGGRCLARGYLNRPEMTAENFFPNPFSDEPGARLYKTGDLARYLPDGNIEFLGRLDDQVKIRGFRVEPGEIEAALCRHPAVRDAVVFVREEDIAAGSSTALRTGTRLVAYLVANQQTSATPSELRGFLKQQLPDYMLPSSFVFLDALPRTSHGKVDRRALPLPDEVGPELDATFVEPRTATEKALAKIWAQVLGLKRIGIHDNFFELGGHSLLATQIISRVRDSFQVELPLRTLFDAPTIAGIAKVIFSDAAAVGRADHRQTRFEDIAANPQERVADFSALTPAERDRIPAHWNDTKKDFPQRKCFHDLFTAQAERAPDGVAVIFEDRQLTYRELNSRASQLARYLQKSGVGPEVAVAVFMERSLEMIVALLGILKAGGAYVPLDPDYPKERLAFMIEDSRIAILLTQQNMLDRLPDHHAPTICLDRDWETIARQDASAPVSHATPQNAAYLIYTSGTTGNPKGAVVEHRSLVNYLCWFNQEVAAEKSPHVPLTAKLTFDASLKQIFAPLLRGDSVWLVADDIANEPAQLLAALAARPASGLNCAPSLWQAALDAIDSGEAAPPKSLSVLWLGGETLNQQLVDRTFAAFPGIEIWNLYGPTEATANATIARIIRDGPITLGRPIANTQIYILDSRLAPVPVGVAGELCIGAVGLARGYLNRPELTAEKFIPNPFSDEPGARLYKTGDRARYLPDGNIEFLGRIDQQIKLRGFRIEPGEIEAALSRHPGVAESVVVARDNQREEKSLVAYVVPRPESASTAGELRSFLNSRLPQHMIPSSFVILENLPLTPNGKVDRYALAGPGQAIPEPTGGFVAPRSGVEEVLAGIWAGVLKIERIGIHDNFFELGGHSLLATQLISRIYGNFAVQVPLRSFLETPTVAGLADFIRQAGESGSEHAAVAIPRAPRNFSGAGLPPSFSQQRLWFLDQLEPGNPAYNMPAAFRITGALDAAALERSLNEIVRRHEALRTTFATVEGQPVQVIAPELTIALPIVDLAEEGATGRAERLFAEEARRPFDLARGPLVRATLLRTGHEEHALLVTMHHIVSDGWSRGVFFRELAALYRAFSSGKPSPLRDLRIQYADFSLWQRERLRGEALASQLSYWKRQLDGAPPALELPTDCPRPPAQTFDGARRTSTLSATLSNALKALSRREGVTLFMTLLTAFKILLGRYSGADDIVVGTPMAGRGESETEELIGFFMNALVLRTDLSGDPSFRELLGRVRRTCVEAYSRDLPFEKLVEELAPARDLSRPPLFQVLLDMFNFPDVPAELPGLTLEPIALGEVMAKYEIVLAARERGGQIRLDLTYSRRLFSEARMAEMLTQLNGLLAQIAANPEEKISRFSLVTREADAVLPDPAAELGSEWHGPVHGFFSAQARRAPERAAVIDSQHTWSYGELEARSNQLARYLTASGIAPGDIVAVYAHRNASLVWALLGVLKAGAAFTILDPDFPASRLVEYLRLAKLRGWIQIEGAKTLPDELEKFLASLGCCCRVALPRSAGEAGGAWSDYATDAPDVAVGPDDLAYVAFTSGSTGGPKGVLCRHGPVTHFFPWLKQTFDFNESDRFSMLSGLSFNTLHREVFTPLSLGATVCIPNAEDIAPHWLAAWMSRQAITIAHLAPAMEQILPGGEGLGLTSLRYAFFAGDLLRKRDVENLRQVAPHVTAVNFYGATETQRAVGYFIVPRRDGKFRDNGAEEDLAEVLPLGQGIQDVQLLVLNPAGRLAGIGEAGEIFFRSPHLARGYLGEDRLTQERFVDNPFTGRAGDRLFKTAERGRYLPDGNVQWIGRMDRQMNIRGLRIEPDEIEAALARHPAVKNAAAIIRESGGDKKLVAYFTCDHESEPRASELRRHLRTTLPEYMIPAAFVRLDGFPLTPNGKVDYRALPAPDGLDAPSSTGYVAPRTPMEKLIAEVWREVLGVERIGVYDNFFDLGGHSLLSLKAISRIEKLTGRRIAPGEIIYHTVEQLAAAREEQSAANAEPLLKRLARWLFEAIYRRLFGAQ